MIGIWVEDHTWNGRVTINLAALARLGEPRKSASEADKKRARAYWRDYLERQAAYRARRRAERKAANK